MVSKYSINRAIINFFCAINVLQTLGFIIIFISFLGYWRIEEYIFKSDYYRLTHIIKIFVFSNLFTNIFTSFSVNVRSKVALDLSITFQSINISMGVFFLLLTIFSFENYYTATIEQRIISNTLAYHEILTKYPDPSYENSLNSFIEETSSVAKGLKILLLLGTVITLLIYFFTNLIMMVPISKSKKSHEEVCDIKNVAMDSLSLKQTKIVST